MNDSGDKPPPTSAASSDLTSKYAKWDKLAKEVDENDEDGGVEKLFQVILNLIKKYG